MEIISEIDKQEQHNDAACDIIATEQLELQFD